MEKKKQHEMCSISSKLFIESMTFIAETFKFVSSLSSDPLFSIFITSYTLILIYFPYIFLNLVFSPILISTALLLSTLLRLGSNQASQKELLASTTDALQWVCSEPETEHVYVPKLRFSESMVEWNRNVRAPLEVIYEEHEGEEEHGLIQKEDFIENQALGIAELVSLSLYYPDSDTESSSDGDFPTIEGWDSPENMCFRWDEEEEDDKDGLIEIQLDGQRCSDFRVEEENMIEIDITITGESVGL